MEEEVWCGYCDFFGGFGDVINICINSIVIYKWNTEKKEFVKNRKKSPFYKYPKDIPFDQLNINIHNKTLTISDTCITPGKTL